MPKPRERSATADSSALQFRARVLHHGEIAFGPGKADLLKAIQTKGSISQAAKTLSMSYMRAWTLVNIMNNAFRDPLVMVGRGGAKGGEARLTSLGAEVLDLYEAIVKESRRATVGKWAQLRQMLKAS